MTWRRGMERAGERAAARAEARAERLTAEDWHAERAEEQRQDGTAQAIGLVVLVAAALDVALGLVVWAVVHCLLGAGGGE